MTVSLKTQFTPKKHLLSVLHLWPVAFLFATMNLTEVAPFLSRQGVYGPVTATLDWCEVSLSMVGFSTTLELNTYD